MARYQHKRNRSVVDVDPETASHLDPRDWASLGKAPAAAPDPNASTQAQQQALGKLLKDSGRGERADRNVYLSERLGREVSAWKDVTGAEADRLIEELKAARPAGDGADQGPGENGE